MKNRLLHILVGFLSFVLIWQALYLTFQNHMFPSPIEVLFFLSTHSIILLQHGFASILRIISSILLALIIGLPLGITIGMNPFMKKLLDPLLYFIYPIPKVAFLPVFIILFGLGNTSKILLVVFIVVFQIILAVRDGVLDIDKDYIKVIQGFSSKKRILIRYVILPAILPRTISALRISIGIALASLFFAENYATKYGIGYFILSAWTKMNYIEMFSGILVLGFTGIMFFGVFDWMEHKFIPWK